MIIVANIIIIFHSQLSDFLRADWSEVMVYESIGNGDNVMMAQFAFLSPLSELLSPNFPWSSPLQTIEMTT